MELVGEGRQGGDLGGGRRRYGGECDQNILYNIVQEVTKELPNFNLCLTNVWATVPPMFVFDKCVGHYDVYVCVAISYEISN